MESRPLPEDESLPRAAEADETPHETRTTASSA